MSDFLHVHKICAKLFTARRYASVVYAVAVVYACVSVTRRYCDKTAKRGITQITPHDRAGTLVFDAKNLGEISTGSLPVGRQMLVG